MTTVWLELEALFDFDEAFLCQIFTTKEAEELLAKFNAGELHRWQVMKAIYDAAQNTDPA